MVSGSEIFKRDDVIANIHSLEAADGRQPLFFIFYLLAPILRNICLYRIKKLNLILHQLVIVIFADLINPLRP